MVRRVPRPTLVVINDSHKIVVVRQMLLVVSCIRSTGYNHMYIVRQALRMNQNKKSLSPFCVTGIFLVFLITLALLKSVLPHFLLLLRYPRLLLLLLESWACIRTHELFGVLLSVR